MHQPTYLTPGDTIGIFAPARSTSIEDLKPAIQIFENAGFKIKLASNILKVNNQFSGTDTERASDFEELLKDKEVKAIISARGGYGSIRTLLNININIFKSNPKWIVGFSDVTVFHSLANICNIESIHATMPINMYGEMYDKDNIDYLIQCLTGNNITYNFESHSLNRKGNCSGILVGGNLSVLYSLRGTPFDIDTKDKILFIEDIDEYLYHIDRMMINLKAGGKLQHLKGMIVGGFTDMKDNLKPFGKTAQEIIADVLGDMDIPLFFDFPAGHNKKNLPLILGRQVRLCVDESCSLTF